MTHTCSITQKMRRKWMPITPLNGVHKDVNHEYPVHAYGFVTVQQMNLRILGSQNDEKYKNSMYMWAVKKCPAQSVASNRSLPGWTQVATNEFLGVARESGLHPPL